MTKNTPWPSSAPRLALGVSLGACLATLLFGRVAAASLLDETFADPKLAKSDTRDPQVFALVVQPDGKVIVGGDFDQVAGQPRVQVARLNTDGSLDETFTSPLDPLLGSSIQALALDGKGGVFIGGSIKVKGVITSLTKLKSDGSFDPTFVPDASMRFVSIFQLEVSGDKLYVGGHVPGSINRLTATGGFDPSFTPYSDTRDQNIYLTFALKPSGSMVADLDQVIVGVGNDGKVDPSFVPLPYGGSTLGQLSDGSVIVYGNFAEINATAPDKRLIHLKDDGTIASTANLEPLVRIFLNVQPDDKILFDVQNGIFESVVGMTLDGKRDGFSVNADDIVRATAPYPGGKLMIVGSFGEVERTKRSHVARVFYSTTGAVGGTSGSGGGDAGADASASGGSGISGDASADSGTGAGGIGTLADAGTASGGSTASGGTPASSGTSTIGDASTGTDGGTKPSHSSDGCGCVIGSGSRPRDIAGWSVIAGLAFLTARRRKTAPLG